jgi:hypothetical protein
MSKEWTRRPIRNIHITVRELDMKGFDARRFVETLVECRCNFVTLLTGGYHSLYRSRLPLVRNNPYLDDGDPLGDLVRLAHDAGIKVGACVDVSAVPRPVHDHHPEWFVRDAHGHPYVITSFPVELYAACAIGGYVDNFVLPVVREHLERYDFDHFNLTGWGFGAYGSGICHCRTCARAYREAAGSEIPLKTDGGDPNWKRYMRWRAGALHEAYARNLEAIRAIKPEIATWINQGYDISETPFAPLENLSGVQDFVKAEAQTKVWFDSIDGEIRLTPMWLAAEEGRYLGTLTDKQVITTTSYYFPWPWRWTAAPEAMEKMWIAEAAANNVAPFVHMSGFPAVLEDKRGMKAVREMFRFLADNEKYYDGARTRTNVAILLSQDSLAHFAGARLRQDYSQHYRGMYAALTESHITFDILSEGSLNARALAKYRVLVLPNAAAMSDGAAAAVRAFVERGGGVLGTYETSLYTAEGEERRDLALGDVFGCSAAGGRMGPLAGTDDDGRRIMAYMAINGAHPVLEGLGDTEVVLNGGHLRLVRPHQGAEVPLTAQVPARVFPEGEAWIPEKRTGVPAAVVHRFGKGHAAYFPGMIDRLYGLFGHPDLRLLLANAVRWLLGGDDLLHVDAPVTVDVALQEQPGRVLLHLINLTGKRPQSEVIPVHGIAAAVRLSARPARVLLASTGRELAFEYRDGLVHVTVDRLAVYDIVVIEN